MSKIRVAVTEPKGQVKLATDHRPSMARPWISALAFKKKKQKEKKKKEEEKKEGRGRVIIRGFTQMYKTSFCFLFFINSLLWFVVWETEARAMLPKPYLSPHSLCVN